MLQTVTVHPETGVDETTSYTYDAAGNQTSITTGTSVTSYEYDERGRIETLTDPMGMQELYVYDTNGNLMTKTDRNNAVTTYVYDGLSRKLSETVIEDSTQTAQTVIVYNITGQLAGTTNSDVTATYSYDDLSRRITESETGGIVKEYEYNTADLRTGFELKLNNVTEQSTSYTYNSMNRLETVLDSASLTATYTYDTNGNRSSVVYANGTGEYYAYNLANLVTSVENKKGAEILSSYGYEYYLDGNQAEKTEDTGRLTAYTYDGSGRLKQETESGPRMP